MYTFFYCKLHVENCRKKHVTIRFLVAMVMCLLLQSRDAIMNGTHPVTQEEAIQLAGIQCHIQFGDYNESKHKAGFLE